MKAAKLRLVRAELPLPEVIELPREPYEAGKVMRLVYAYYGRRGGFKGGRPSRKPPNEDVLVVYDRHALALGRGEAFTAAVTEVMLSGHSKRSAQRWLSGAIAERK